jgi:hypothetical protein
MLENRYRLPTDARTIDYSKFLEEINSVFTISGLEKDPLARPEEFKKGSNLDPNDILTSEEEALLHETLTQLGEFLRKNRINFKTHFQDKVIFILYFLILITLGPCKER